MSRESDLKGVYRAVLATRPAQPTRVKLEPSPLCAQSRLAAPEAWDDFVAQAEGDVEEFCAALDPAGPPEADQVLSQVGFDAPRKHALVKLTWYKGRHVGTATYLLKKSFFGGWSVQERMNLTTS